MKRSGVLLIVLVTMLFTGCIKNDFNSLPDYSTTNLEHTIPLDTVFNTYLEGVYELLPGDDRFGRQLVGKWANGYLCFYGQNEGKFMNLQVGFNPDDSSLRMAGFWYDPIKTNQGQIQFTIAKEEGVDSIFHRKCVGIMLRGYLDSDPAKAITIIYKRPFSSTVLSRSFIIGAHRGGGRNSDNLPYAENSLNLVKHAMQFGATGVEIDIRLTKDKVPIVYHDPDINTRLTLKSPLVGNVDQFNADFLRAYIKLVDGQVIPTLDEMLTTIIDSTDMRLVWLDCKDGGKDGFFSLVIPVLKNATNYARSKGRKVSILLGLPDDDAYDNFIALSDFQNIPSLCEISLEKARIAGSHVFAPRWTLGILEQETADAHAVDMKVITWTLDDPEGMDEVITKSNYDGILTNYPSILAYQFYSQE